MTPLSFDQTVVVVLTGWGAAALGIVAFGAAFGRWSKSQSRPTGPTTSTRPATLTSASIAAGLATRSTTPAAYGPPVIAAPDDLTVVHDCETCRRCHPFDQLDDQIAAWESELRSPSTGSTDAGGAR